MNEFSHIDERGRPRMVDVGGKEPAVREARARAVIRLKEETIAAIRDAKIVKGNVIETARLAGIMAAKMTPQLIPLSHPIRLTSVGLDAELGKSEIVFIAVARAVDRTGVEMEAMVAASVAALTVYDMCKSADRSAVITEIALLEKKGGKSGHWHREEPG